MNKANIKELYDDCWLIYEDLQKAYAIVSRTYAGHLGDTAKGKELHALSVARSCLENASDVLYELYESKKAGRKNENAGI